MRRSISTVLMLTCFPFNFLLAQGKRRRGMITLQVFSFMLVSFWCFSGAYAQTRTVTGTVTDQAGEPVNTATISAKGTQVATTSDAKGNFRINMPVRSKALVISFIGMQTQEVDINGQANVNISLSFANTNMNEVVVVGYGRQKKITLTGAVSSVSGAEIRQNPSASLQNTLSGRLPGFSSQQTSGRPGQDGAAFFIRGQSSYNEGASSPLIIVDDIEFTYDQFARLDPNEIESLSILKDASTTAVYGIRGANGVVVVTTRRGKIGPGKVSLRIENSLQQPSRIPKFLDAYQSAVLFNQGRANDNLAPQFTAADLELFKSGADPYGHPNIDWKSVLFKKFSSQTRGNLDISGGTDKVKYFVSAGYIFQDGILKNYSKDQGINANYYHRRYNYRSNLDMKITKALDLRLDLYGNIGETNNPNVGSPFGYNDIFYEYSSFLSLSPFAYPVYNPDGSFGYSRWQRNEAGGGQYNTNNVVGRLTHYGYNRDNENNMNFVASANHKLDFITKGLSLKGTVSYASTYYYTRGTTRDQFPSFLYDPVANTYEPRDPNIYRVRRYFLQYNSRATTRTVNLQGILNYDRSFGEHHVYGLALFSQNSFTGPGTATYNFIPNNFRGFTTRIGYDYKQKYLFQFNGAYNGSDRFSESNRFGVFPAVSAGWNISEEGFFKNNIRFIDRLKIRGSYGLVGNDKIGTNFSYFYLPEYTNTNGGNGQVSFGNNHNGFTGIQEGRLANENVSWEKEKKFDLGLEFSLLNNNLNATVEFFNNNRYDILTNRGTVSAIFGQSLPPVNFGKVNNRGYEFELGYRGNAGKNFTFSLKGTYSFAKNKILLMDEPTPLYPYQAFTGNSIGQILVYKWIGFYRDQDDILKSPKTVSVPRPGDLKYEDINNDGLINDFDKAILGNPNIPNTTAGVQIGLGFKNVNLNVLFQGARNFNVRGAAEAIRAFSSNFMDIHTKSWTPQLGDDAQYPLLSNAGGLSDPGGFPSTFWFIPGDYIRLKTAELSYALPKRVVQRMKVQELRIYTNGYNLLTWSKLDKRYEFDPEIRSGTDRINYPPQRMYNLGVSVTF